jgi:hypothetical protein
MSTESGAKSDASLWQRWIGSRRSPLIAVGIGLVLVLALLVAVYLDGLVDELVSQGSWRVLLTPAAVIVYILVVAPYVERAEAGVIDAFRPIVLIDDDRFDQLVTEASRINPTGQAIALCLGALFGLWMGQTWVSDTDAFWLKLVLIPSNGLMFGLLAWAIYGSVIGTRLMAQLHRQPLRIDILDTSPFWPVGRYGLIIALVFVGGIVLGMVFGLQWESILDWRSWVLYGLLAVVPIVVFFLSMRPTHRVLSAEKKRELTVVETKIGQACRTLVARLDAGEGTGTLGSDVTALVAYEERLQAASSWPYDTAMLRTLFVSVIIPGAAALARVVGELMFD